MRKCRNCLCRTCIKSCKCRGCKGKIKECKRYRGFRQLSIFDEPPEPKYQKAPRYSWDYYGITKERYKQLTEYIQSGRYTDITLQAAHRANKDIAEYILLSVTKNKSYDALRIKWQLKEIEQMPCCRTDFYGYRRYFYHLFDEMIKEGNVLEKSDGEQYLTGQKISGFPVYSKMPEGWKIDSGAMTAPKGYVIISNRESRFGGKRKTGITAVVVAKGD